jgi:prepilin-type N-terminal cleavage/methylation domain-containing protein
MTPRPPTRVEDADAIIYDGASNRVFTFNGDAHSSTVIDPQAGNRITDIPLGGKSEYGASASNGGFALTPGASNEQSTESGFSLLELLLVVAVLPTARAVPSDDDTRGPFRCRRTVLEAARPSRRKQCSVEVVGHASDVLENHAILILLFFAVMWSKSQDAAVDQSVEKANRQRCFHIVFRHSSSKWRVASPHDS